MAVWLTIKHMFTYGSVAHNKTHVYMAVWLTIKHMWAHNKTHVYIWQCGSQ